MGTVNTTGLGVAWLLLWHTLRNRHSHWEVVMALQTPMDLFLFEMSLLYHGQQKIVEFLDEAADRVPHEGITELLRARGREVEQELANLERCFEAVGSRPEQVSCERIEGLRRDYADFMSRGPSPMVATMYVLGSTMKISSLEKASYRGLVDLAVLLGYAECTRILQSNRVLEEESAGRHERLSHDLNAQAVAPP
jgi:ferritin-like metal-binding protein YciE